MKKSALSILFIAGVLSIYFLSCKKDKPQPEVVAVDTESASDNSEAEAEFTNMFNDVNDAGTNEFGTNKTSGDTCWAYNKGCNSCVKIASITPCWIDSLWPKTLTLDFGTGTCTSCDGKVRKGKLQVTFTKRWREAGAVATVVTDGYYVNNNLVTGEAKYTNVSGFDTSCVQKLQITKIVNAIGNTSGYATIATSSGTIQWKASRTMKLVSGCAFDTIFSDHVYETYGTADGINKKGNAFSVNIPSSTPLKKAVSCQWVQDGLVEITPQGLATRSVNFANPNSQGSGVCDNKAEVSVNGQSVVITLQ